MKGLPYNSEFFANSSGFNFQDSEFTGVGRDMYVVINYAPNGIQFLDAGDRQGATEDTPAPNSALTNNENISETSSVSSHNSKNYPTISVAASPTSGSIIINPNSPLNLRHIMDQLTPTLSLLRAWHSGCRDHFYTTDSEEMSKAHSIHKYTLEGSVGRLLVKRPLPLPMSPLGGASPKMMINSIILDCIALVEWINATLSSLVSLHRLYHPRTHDHFYTASDGELVNAGRLGYSYEGIAGYIFQVADNAPGHILRASGTPSGAKVVEALVPLYRLFSPKGNDHFYTISKGESDNAVAKFGYQYEGIVGWVLRE